MSELCCTSYTHPLDSLHKCRLDFLVSLPRCRLVCAPLAAQHTPAAQVHVRGHVLPVLTIQGEQLIVDGGAMLTIERRVNLQGKAGVTKSCGRLWSFETRWMYLTLVVFAGEDIRMWEA